MRDPVKFDAIQLEVLWTRLISIVSEAGVALQRMAFSSLVREALDFSCIITDANGHGLAQPPTSIPSFIGTLPATVRHFLAEFPLDALDPGDVLITNDPWRGTGHLSDVTVAKPVFYDGKIVAFAASTAHLPDMGGQTGSSESRDVFEEGFQIPMMKLLLKGKRDESLIKLLATNVRVPDEVIADLFAQVSALNLIEHRLLGLMNTYRLVDLGELAREIHDRSEAAMRKAISDLPDGISRFVVKTDGLSPPVSIHLAIEIRGDTLTVDYAGTSPQSQAAVNSALCYTFAYTMYGLKCLLSSEIPNNEGATRPISVKAPPGCVVNHSFPNSGCSRSMVGHYLPFAVFGALAAIVPDRVMAGTGSPVWSILMRGRDDAGTGFANKFFFNGGLGATHRNDGINTMSWPTNVSITPAEVFEHEVPCRVVYKRLREGSGGKGTHRGGLGQDILIQSLAAAPMTLVFQGERTVHPAPGMAGGEAGALGELLLDGLAIDPKRQHTLQAGGQVLMRLPGGGGFGPDADRDAALRQRDETLGYV